MNWFLRSSSSKLLGLNFHTYRHFSSTPSIIRQFEALRDVKNGPTALVSEANQIHFNLALESYLMEVVKPKVPVFLWWRNDKNVVIGRNQNPWKECDIAKMEQDGIDLARRFSGGGAVYQDLGNSCFTFLIPENEFKKTLNNSILLSVLKETFGIESETSGRNDLVTAGRKFSGAAFKYIKDPINHENNLSLHHGTFLMNTDFGALKKYLTPSKLKLQAKGVSSVESRVVNLNELNNDITHESLREPLIKEFYKSYSKNKVPEQNVEVLTRSSEFTLDPLFQSILSQLTNWEWRFGITPRFTHLLEKRFNWGTTEVNLDVYDGIIRQVKIFTDCLIPELVSKWEEKLTGCPYITNHVHERLTSINPITEDHHCLQVTKELSEWIQYEMMK